MMSPTQSRAGDDSWDIALALDIPGKGGWTTCAPYAKELYSRITRAGGEAYLVVFDWRNEDHMSDRHAMVVYRDSHGRYWGMDQRATKPVWLSGKDPAQWANYFSRAETVKLYAVYTNPANVGQYADLSRPRQRVVYVPYGTTGRDVAAR